MRRSDPVKDFEKELCDTVWTVVGRLLDSAIARSQSLRKFTRGMPPNEVARRRDEIRNAILDYNFETIVEKYDPGMGRSLATYVAHFAKPGSLRQEWDARPAQAPGAPSDEPAMDIAIERLAGDDPVGPEVRAILEGLPPHLIRFFSDGLTAADAGAPDGLTAVAVYRDSKRVRNQLRRLLPHRRDK